MIQLDIRSRSRTKNSTRTSNVVKNPTLYGSNYCSNSATLLHLNIDQSLFSQYCQSYYSVYSLLTEHNRIEKTQCSFTENHSTELAITAICDELLSNFDKELITCSLFFIFFLFLVLLKAFYYFWSY